MMKLKQKKKFIYGLLAAIITACSIGGVAAMESGSGAEYEAPDLQIVIGEDYDLLSGIVYDSDKYELSVEDASELDVSKEGEYQVDYVLTPKAETADAAEADQTVESVEETEEASAGAEEAADTEAAETADSAEDNNTSAALEPIHFTRTVYVVEEASNDIELLSLEETGRSASQPLHFEATAFKDLVETSYQSGDVDYVSELLLKYDWSKFAPGTRETDSSTGETKTMKNGGQPDVTLTLNKDLKGSMLYTGYDGWSGWNDGGKHEDVTADSSLLIDGTGSDKYFIVPTTKNGDKGAIRYSTDSTGNTESYGSEINVPEMQLALKNLKLKREEKLEGWWKGYICLSGQNGYTLDDTDYTYKKTSAGTYIKLENISRAAEKYDVGNDWNVTAGTVEFIADKGVDTVNLRQNVAYNTIIKQTGDHDNYIGIKNIKESLTLDLSEGQSNFLELSCYKYSEDAKVILKGANGVAKMTKCSDFENEVQAGCTQYDESYGFNYYRFFRDSFTDNYETSSDTLWYDTKVINTYARIFAPILDVQTEKGKDMTILKATGSKTDQPAVQIGNTHLSNGRQIIIGRADAELRDGETIAKGGGVLLDIWTGELKIANTNPAVLCAADFKSKDEDKHLYAKNNGENEIIVTKLDGKAIQVISGGETKERFDSYKDAFEWIEANGDGGEYTVKILVPRYYTAEDQAALAKVTPDKASKLIFTAADGSTIDNGYMRMRVANKLETVELPKDVAVEFKDITVRRSNADGTKNDQVIFVKNGGSLTFSGNYQTLGDQAEIYGGSFTDECDSDVDITVKAGVFQNIYGGGKKVQTGDVKISIEGGTVENAIYGGGKGAKVTGNTDITYTVQNDKDAKTDTLVTISGAGTDADGKTFTSDVSGTKNITLKKSSLAHTGALSLTNLTGFDNLKIDNENGTTNDKTLVCVTGRFDSNAVDTSENNRTSVVELAHSSLFLMSKQSGHIGSLKTIGDTLLVIPELDGAAIPLKVDQLANDIQEEHPLKLAIMHIDHAADMSTAKAENEVGDNIISFVNGVSSDIEQWKYQDGLNSRLDVVRDDGDDVSNIQFGFPKAHIAGGYVEYPDNVPDTLTQTADKKTVHLVYDKRNEHEVRTNKLGGYVVVMPKDQVNEQDAAKYTVTDKQFMADGTFSDEMEGLTYYEVNFTLASEKEDGASCHEATAEVEIKDMDTTKNWYILHTVCSGGEDSVVLLDVDAPEKAEEEVKTSYDSTTSDYTYELRLKDTTVNDRTQLPSKKPGTDEADKNRLSYAANGITSAYWAIGDADGSNLADADTEAVKQKDGITISDTATSGLLGKGTVTALASGTEGTQGGFTARVVITVPKAIADSAQSDTLWVYAKDGVNNTIRIAVPLQKTQEDEDKPDDKKDDDKKDDGKTDNKDNDSKDDGKTDNTDIDNKDTDKKDNGSADTEQKDDSSSGDVKEPAQIQETAAAQPEQTTTAAKAEQSKKAAAATKAEVSEDNELTTEADQPEDTEQSTEALQPEEINDSMDDTGSVSLRCFFHWIELAFMLMALFLIAVRIWWLEKCKRELEELEEHGFGQKKHLERLERIGANIERFGVRFHSLVLTLAAALVTVFWFVAGHHCHVDLPLMIVFAIEEVALILILAYIQSGLVSLLDEHQSGISVEKKD